MIENIVGATLHIDGNDGAVSLVRRLVFHCVPLKVIVIVPHVTATDKYAVAESGENIAVSDRCGREGEDGCDSPRSGPRELQWQGCVCETAGESPEAPKGPASRCFSFLNRPPPSALDSDKPASAGDT